MNHYEPGISYPRRRDDWVRDHPLASRLLIMIVGFAVLVPIGLVIRASQGNVVRSGCDRLSAATRSGAARGVTSENPGLSAIERSRSGNR